MYSVMTSLSGGFCDLNDTGTNNGAFIDYSGAKYNGFEASKSIHLDCLCATMRTIDLSI